MSHQVPAENLLSEILLTTINAKYSHASLGLRYLYANLGALQPRARIVEFTLSQNARDIAESILAHEPKVLGLGVYIWNTTLTFEVISILKRIRPDLTIVLGGPEVSHETEVQAICATADYVIRGEGDFLFRELCEKLLSPEGERPARKVIQAELPEIKKIESPYAFYSDEDIRNRILYVEASRGCPYRCEYCLSSLDKSVRNFELDRFLQDMESLIERGARQFKFVDRTFNLGIPTSTRILRFFLDRMDRGLFIHFELVPDRLPPELRDLIREFPEGSLQFEIGIQTWNPVVAARISRRQDYEKIRENLRFLADETGVHVHADLIVGLPGESLESFGVGFDQLIALGPEEIQVGILKRLRGTPIIRHDQEWGMVYQEHPPYPVLKTKVMDFKTLQAMGRFAKFWDLVANSGNFKSTLRFLKGRFSEREDRSFFNGFLELSRALSLRHPQGNGIALLNLLESVWIYLTQELGVEERLARDLLVSDYTGNVKRDIPVFLRDGQTHSSKPHGTSLSGSSDAVAAPPRQRRHLRG